MDSRIRRVIVGSITLKQAETIVKEKMKDLNAHSIEEATKIICGSARSMGIEVKNNEKKSKRFKALLEQKDKIKVDNLDSKLI